MKLDDALRDLLRERGADEDMLRWLEEPEAVREALLDQQIWRTWHGMQTQRPPTVFLNPRDFEALYGVPIEDSSTSRGEAIVSAVNAGSGTFTVTYDNTAPVQPGDRVRPVDRRPAPVRMAEERARRRARTR